MALLTVVTTSVPYASIGDWGLVTRLPVVFWCGLSSLLVLVYLCMKSRTWRSIVFILTITYLFVVPTLIQENAMLLGTSYPAAEGKLISIEGRLVPDNYDINRYHNFPGFLYFVAILTSLTGVPLPILCKYVPLLLVTLFGLLIYLVLRTKLKTQEAFAGTLWFLGSFWMIDGNYFSPQEFSFASFALTFLIFTWLFLNSKAQGMSRRLMIVAVILFASCTFTHILTSVLILSYLIPLLVLHRTGIRGTRFIIGMLLLSFESLYLVFYAYPFLKYALLKTLEELPSLLKLQFVRAQLVGSLSQTLTNVSRILIMVISGAVALVSIGVLILRRSKQNEKYWLLSLAGIILPAFISVYGLSEMLIRLFMFALFPLVYFCVKLIRNKPWILCAIVCVLLILHVPAHYGGTSVEGVATSELAAASFCINSVPRTISCFSLTIKPVTLIWFQEPASFSSAVYLNSLSAINETTITTALEKSELIIYSQGSVDQFLYYQGKVPIDKFTLEEQFDKIYDNPFVSLFINQKQA
jgi:hypothetical protein